MSYQPGCGSSSHLINPVVHASSSTPADDSSLSTSISKRVRDEPYGPNLSAADDDHQVGRIDVEVVPFRHGGAVTLRGGDGSAAMVCAVGSSSVSASLVISSRDVAASSDMSRSTSASPPVRSTFIGSRAAAILDSMSHRSSSIRAISSVE